MKQYSFWAPVLLALSLYCLTGVPAEAASEAPAAMEATFDARAATEAYLATVSGEVRERSDAYFEGGYWIQLWGFLIGIAVSWLLLRNGFSARVRDWVEVKLKRRWMQTMLYGGIYVILSTLLVFPWTLYTDFFREHQYGMATQGIGAWLGDQFTSLLVSIVMMSIFLAVIYALLRRTKERWWLWGTGVTAAMLALFIMISPVFIAPLFNTYTPLDNPKLEGEILAMAKSQGVSFERVFVVDASAQTTRISANVSGLGATKRISLNDNLLNSGTLAEIKAVMGHELGHYVLGHIYFLVASFSLLFGVGYFLVTKAYPKVVARWGAGWGLRGIDDVAGFPLLMALLSAYLFLTTPIFNSIIRWNESQADVFGLDVAKEPDGFATISLKLSDYRKLDPSPLEEIIFYDHPSGRTRIQMAMEWKARHSAESN